MSSITSKNLATLSWSSTQGANHILPIKSMIGTSFLTMQHLSTKSALTRLILLWHLSTIETQPVFRGILTFYGANMGAKMLFYKLIKSNFMLGIKMVWQLFKRMTKSGVSLSISSMKTKRNLLKKWKIKLRIVTTKRKGLSSSWNTSISILPPIHFSMMTSSSISKSIFMMEKYYWLLNNATYSIWHKRTSNHRMILTRSRIRLCKWLSPIISGWNWSKSSFTDWV